ERSLFTTTSAFNVLCRFSGIKNPPVAGFAYFAIAYKIGKISDLHGIYDLQFYFARYGSKLSDFFRERTRITEIRASLSSISALPRIANQ
ncbi:TPA: hypothetical protein GF669_25195, partial [Escherichia coli]|nr:hypothetical protein [Escherichia coli]